MSGAVYSLEELKILIKGKIINPGNYGKIIKSLCELPMTAEVITLLEQVAKSESVPLEDRQKLTAAIVAYKEAQPVEEVVTPIAPVVEEQLNDQSSIVQETATPDNELALQNTLTTAGMVGMRVVASNAGLDDKKSFITFEINPESKPYIDHMLLELYGNKDGVDLQLTKLNSSNRELFTIEVNNNGLSQEQKVQKISETLTTVKELIETTDKNKNYEMAMSDNLKTLKQTFNNDRPDINQEDYTIGYNKQEGNDNYYIVASSKEKAEEVSKKIGYELDKDLGGNTYSIKTNGLRLEGTKLDNSAIHVDEIDEIKNPKSEGIPDVDVRYNRQFEREEPIETIDTFMKENPNATMHVTTTDSSDGQKYVEMNDGNGNTKKVVVRDSDSLGNYTSTNTTKTEESENSRGNETATFVNNPVDRVMSLSIGTHPGFKDAAFTTVYVLAMVAMLAYAFMIVIKYIL